MKILILTTVMAPYRVNLFNELGKYCELTVCFEKKQDSSRNAAWYENNMSDFKAVFLRSWDKPAYRIRWEILKMISRYQPDLCIAYEYSTPTSIIFMSQCSARKVPYYINCDGAFISRNFLRDAIKRYFIGHAKGCLANGEHAKEYFLHYGAKKENIFMHNFSTLYKKDILPSCVTKAEKEILKQKFGFRNKKTVITAGQFIYQKGFDVLLKAWDKITVDARLIIIGGGEKEEEYNEFIELHNLKGIMILEFKPFLEVLECLKACELFVLPTRGDVWGLVINEAMACGLPVITTDRCGAGLELVTNGENGHIVPVDDVDALAEKIQYVLENDELMASMGEASLEKIRAYTIEDVAKSHMEVFLK